MMRTGGEASFFMPAPATLIPSMRPWGDARVHPDLGPEQSSAASPHVLSCILHIYTFKLTPNVFTHSFHRKTEHNSLECMLPAPT